jgi:N-acetyl-alpha-D-muramate 1-phosphate uridylyltransferase
MNMRGKVKKAMVLAAGYGTRLKPLTDRVPKPLVPVAGKPMIQYALDQLQAYGIQEVVINVSHLKEPLTAWLAGCKKLTVKLSEEAEPLETGGGLKKALPLLGNEPVFAINSDILWTDEFPSLAGAGEGGQRPDEGRGTETALDRLASHWDDAKMDFLLLVQPRSKAVGYDKGEDHLFVKQGNTIEWDAAEAPYVIAGVGIFHPRALRGAPDGKFSVKILWHQALAQNRLFCLPHQGRWFQTGTLADIKTAEEQLKP